MKERYHGKHTEGGTPHRRKRPPLTKKQKWLIAAAALLAVALAVTIAWQALFVKPVLPNKTDDGSSGSSAEGIDYGEGIRPRVDGERKSKDFYTVLILGRDTGGGGNTDTILLASYDVTNQKATVMSIPRDTMVNVSWDIKRINSVYNAYGGGDKGIQALYKEIAQLVGFEPDYQVVVEWEAVGQIVEAMGGVWFDVPQDMDYDDPYQDLSIHQKEGYRLLSGEDAMEVLRYRHDNPKNGHMRGYPDGDLGRIRTQQGLLQAMLSQLLKLENITKVNQFAKVFQENVETDLSLQNILWFAKSAYLGGLKVENVHFVTMPNDGRYAYSYTYHNAQSYVVPRAEELLELVNSELSPFTEVFTLSDLDIMSVNEDGTLSSSTGHLESSRASQRPPVQVNRFTGAISAWPGTSDPTDPGTTDPTEPTDPEPTDPGTTSPTDPGATEPSDPEPTDPVEPMEPTEPEPTDPDPGSGSGDGAA